MEQWLGPSRGFIFETRAHPALAADKLECQTCSKCSHPVLTRQWLWTSFSSTPWSQLGRWLKMVDIASIYQVVIPLENRRSDTVAQTFYKHSIAWAHIPGRLVIDLDTAFQDSFCRELTSDHSIAMRSAAGQAHWQNGICRALWTGMERHIWQRVCTQHHV